MEAIVKAFNGRLQIKVEAGNMPDLFRITSQVMEVLGSDQNCGACNSDSIRPQARKSEEGYDFYELVCNNCGAELKMGQKKVGGTLWPKRKDEQGRPLANRGWLKYDRAAKDQADLGPRPPNRRR